MTMTDYKQPRAKPKNASYTTDDLGDVERRTRCRCERPNPIKEVEQETSLSASAPIQRTYISCMKCGKSL